jgi:hypothetical protein
MREEAFEMHSVTVPFPTQSQGFELINDFRKSDANTLNRPVKDW